MNLLNLAIQLNKLSLEHLKLDQTGEFYGSDIQINLFNLAGDAASEALGYEISENDDWLQNTANATSIEIAQYNITVLEKAVAGLVNK